MKIKSKIDYVLLSVVFILLFIGITMIYSSSYYSAMVLQGNKNAYLVKQLIVSAVGLLGMFIFMNFDYKKLKNLAWLAMIISIGMLALLYLPVPFTVTVNNSTRWLKVAGGFNISPSEIAKFSGILLTANLLTYLHGKMSQVKRLTPFILMSCIVGALIYKQPDLSTAIVFVVIIWAMVFVGGMRWSIVLGAAGIGVSAIYLSVKFTSYRLGRFLAFLDPLAYRSDEGYQISQALYAIARGGLTGVGLGQSTLNKLYLPEPQNDFILATLLEEFGFVGGVVTIGLFLFLIYKCVKITIKANDPFGFYLGTGITALISIHVMINLMVTVSLMPVTGIPLPFLSYGGTFLIICLSCMGIMLNISKNTDIDIR